MNLAKQRCRMGWATIDELHRLTYGRMQPHVMAHQARHRNKKEEKCFVSAGGLIIQYALCYLGRFTAEAIFVW